MSKIIAVIVAAAALAAPAVAETSDQNFNFKFRVDQSALSTSEGAVRIHQQLRTQATDACRPERASVIRYTDKRCRDELVDAAVKRINNPMLTAAHSGGSTVASN